MLAKDVPLPKKFLDVLGIEKLNPPQIASLQAGLLDNKNLVVASPTASGKTLVAELAIMKNFLAGGKALYIVPLRALASEKYHEFKEKYSKLGMRVAVSTGDLDSSDDWLGNYDLIVMSNEKADSLLRHGARWMADVTLIIADEIHMLNDPSRGPTLEIVLTRLRSIANAQILALSATISNAEEIAEWLSAELVRSEYRPITLYHGVSYPQFKEDILQYTIDFIGKKNELLSMSGDGEVVLSKNAVERQKQALVFLSTRRSAEATAEKIGKELEKYLPREEKAKIAKLAQEVESCLPYATKQCKRLAKIIRTGAAFHHAGLVAKQRKLIEDSFRAGLIKIITATPTLCLDKNCKIWNGTTEIEINEARNHNVLALKAKRLYEIPVHKINSMPSPKEMIKIITICGNQITVTKNHRFLVKKNSTREEIEAELCEAGDRIATVGRIRLKNHQTPKWSDFVKDNKLPFNDAELDENIFYLIGAFLGDGYSGAEMRNKKIIYKGSPCIVGRDLEIFDKIKNICNKFSIHYKIGNNSYGVPQIVLTKANWFREFLVRTGVDIGKRKYIHTKILESDEKNISSLLRGLFDTDGYVERRGDIGITSISLPLIECIKKALLRFGIVTYFRKRDGKEIQLYEKKYQTKEHYELSVFHSKCIEMFHKTIGFSIRRKQNSLENIINNSNKNILKICCNNCDYTIIPNIFNPRSKQHKEWASQRIKIIKYLGENGKKMSSELQKELGYTPWKNERRLNSHFGFIERKRIGNNVLWELNKIGQWLFTQLKEGKNIEWFLEHNRCPLCNNLIDKTKRENWRKYDLEGDIFWDIVKSVEGVAPSSKKVYDVVLPSDGSSDHFFVSNGFIVHNSFGVNLPAWRVLIRDVKRYTDYGYQFIPVLEIQQMSGRAGRPTYDKEGEAIILAKSKQEAEELKERYILSGPEAIISKLSNEPLLRMHTLALVAGEVCRSKRQLLEFFSKTFFAYQYKDLEEIEKKLEKIIKDLEGFGFIVVGEEDDRFISSDFIPAFDLARDLKLKTTRIGKRVSELYIDPLSAWQIIQELRVQHDIAYLMTINHCIEMYPTLAVRTNEYDEYSEELARSPLTNIPDVWDVDYDEYLCAFKTSNMFMDWANEMTEDRILDKYNMPPGELYNKTKNAEWLLYAARELAILLGRKEVANRVNKLMLRIKHGVAEELLSFIRLKGIGRVRARLLWSNRIRSISELKKIPMEILSEILGVKIARAIKEELNKPPEKLR